MGSGKGGEVSPQSDLKNLYYPPTTLPSLQMDLEDPYFVESAPASVEGVIGKTSYLVCSVKNRGNHSVSWVRLRDIHLITVGTYTYTSDLRFRPLHKPSSDDWILEITDTRDWDQGDYECQISSTPVKRLTFSLQVVGRSHGSSDGLKCWRTARSPQEAAVVTSKRATNVPIIAVDCPHNVTHCKKETYTVVDGSDEFYILDCAQTAYEEFYNRQGRGHITGMTCDSDFCNYISSHQETTDSYSGIHRDYSSYPHNQYGGSRGGSPYGSRGHGGYGGGYGHVMTDSSSLVKSSPLMLSFLAMLMKI